MFARIRPTPFFCGLAALALAIAGQIQIESDRLLPAALLYLLALGIFIVAFRKQPGPTVVFASLQPARTEKRALWGYLSGGLAIVSTILAFWMFSTAIPAIIPWLLHLASIGLLVFSVFWLDGAKRKDEEQNRSWSWLEAGLFLAIFAIAAFMRLYRFDQVPFGTWYDEADNGLSALRILTEPGYLPVYVESTNLPAHLLYLIALSFRILGVSILSVRAVSVVFGLATVAVAYLTGRELFDRRMGLVLAFLLAVSRWDINWSRIGMHGISVPFFELVTIYFILRGLRRQRLLDYTLAGLSAGFGLCFYTPFRIFPLVIGLFLLVLWLGWHAFIRSSWRGLLLFGLGVLIASVPVTQYAVFNSSTFFERMRVTSIFTGKTPQEGWQAVAQTTREHLLMFNDRGDRNGRHNLPGEPMLDPLSGALLVLGVGLSLWRIRQPASFLLLAWWLVMLAPGIFSLDLESPQSLRAIGSLPGACLLVAVPIHAFIQEWDRFAKKRSPFLFLLPLIIFLGGLGYFNYDVYFDRQANSFNSWVEFSTPHTIIAKTMAESGNQADYYVSTFYYNSPTIRFLAPQVTAYHELQTHDTFPLHLDGKKRVIFFIDPDRKPFFLQAKLYYPNAVFKEIKAPDGNIVLYEIILQPADITAPQGLTASYFYSANGSDKPFLVRTEKNINLDWQDGDPAPFPLGVEWQGVLYAHTYGAYRLIVRAPAAVELYIDETRVVLKGDREQTAEVLLAKGTHTLRLRTEVKEGHFELAWQPPSEAETPIPPSSLYLPPITNNGLLGSYYANANWQAPPAFTQIDPWIHFYYHNPPLPRPYTVEWVGMINISKAGKYRFGLESIDESSLDIDDRLILNDLTSNQYQESEVELAPGFHPIRLRFTDRTGGTHINIYWTPPDSERALIPQEVLFPPQGELEQIQPAPEGGITPSPQNPVVITGMPVIPAKLLWQTGECGSGSGQFQAPHGITADPQGNIWIADTGNQRVVKMDPDGIFLQSFGESGYGAGQFLQPVDLVLEPDGNLVILDSEAQKVLRRFSPSGKFLGAIGSDLGTYFPRGMGIDRLGNIYIADTGGSRLLRITPDGIFEKQWVIGKGAPNLGRPISVAVAADGALYSFDGAGSQVSKITTNGDIRTWSAPSNGDAANGPHLQIGPNNAVFITDPEQNRVVVYTSDGQPVGQIRLPDDADGLLSKPVGIAIGPDGVLVVSDAGRCRVLAFQLPDGF